MLTKTLCAVVLVLGMASAYAILMISMTGDWHRFADYLRDIIRSWRKKTP